MILDQTEAKREWVARWVFSKTGTRPKLDRISNRDLSSLFRAITAIEGLKTKANSCANITHKKRAPRATGIVGGALTTIAKHIRHRQLD
jgi:hypothetical protein